MPDVKIMLPYDIPNTARIMRHTPRFQLAPFDNQHFPR
jgi:hypothetical protein